MQKNSLPTHQLDFEDNRLLPLLFGERDRHLTYISEVLTLSITARGNRLWLQGEPHKIAIAETVLKRLYDRLQQGLAISIVEIDAALRLASSHTSGSLEGRPMTYAPIATRRKIVNARTDGQGRYLDALRKNDMVFGIGPAGTGKTFLAVATAVSWLLSGHVKRIILSRPAVEAGEHLGFLPGALKEKIDPYLRPLYDSLFEMLPDETINKRFETGEIEVAPLAFMRGRTLNNAFVILDEAQNTTEAQMKMFLTRMGENSRMVITGDLTQIDLPSGVGSGLKQAVHLLKNVEGIALCELSSQDIVRHPLVTRIVNAYEGLHD